MARIYQYYNLWSLCIKGDMLGNHICSESRLVQQIYCVLLAEVVTMQLRSAL